MTVQLESFVGSVRFIRVFECSPVYKNSWASIIRTFQLSELTQVPMSLDKRGTTIYRNF